MEGKLDFGKRPIPGLLWALFVPTIVGMLFSALFLVVDGIFIGKGIGPNGLAAVNLFEPILVLYLGIGTMIGAGCSVQTAIEMSQGKIENAKACVTRAYALVLAFCILSASILYLFPHTILVLVGATPTLEPIATEYYRWFIPSACFIAIQIAASFIIRLDESPKYVMVSSIVGTIINLVLDYLFIIKLGMGMRGAAMATNIGTGVSVLMSVYYMLFLCKNLRLTIPVSTKDSGRILKLGSPSFISEITSGTISLFGNIMFGQYLKDKGIAAFSIICYLTPIVYTVLIALSSSMQPIVSYNHGCGNITRVKKTLKISLFVSAGCAVLTAAIIFIFSQWVASIFLNSGTESHNLASKGLKLFSIAYLFSGINIIIITFLQSIEKIRQSMILTILRSFIFIALAFLIAPRVVGLSGLWLAVPTSEFATFAICIVILLWNYRKYHAEHQLLKEIS